MQLYSYARSSAAFRVRIALELKGLAYEYRAVNLLAHEQQGEPYAAVSASRLVPQLVDGDVSLSQSLAIIEYLEERWPEPALLPRAPAERARVRSLALDIACEIHPLDNLRVLRYLVGEMGVSEEAKNRWYRHWVEQGLRVVEHRLGQGAPAGRYCHGDMPGLADCVLVPQIFNAKRFACSLEGLPRVMTVFDACMALPAIQRAQPSACPDFQA